MRALNGRVYAGAIGPSAGVLRRRQGRHMRVLGGAPSVILRISRFTTQVASSAASCRISERNSPSVPKSASRRNCNARSRYLTRFCMRSSLDHSSSEPMNALREKASRAATSMRLCPNCHISYSRACREEAKIVHADVGRSRGRWGNLAGLSCFVGSRTEVHRQFKAMGCGEAVVNGPARYSEPARRDRP